jgi:hypothetical protein
MGADFYGKAGWGLKTMRAAVRATYKETKRWVGHEDGDRACEYAAREVGMVPGFGRRKKMNDERRMTNEERLARLVEHGFPQGQTIACDAACPHCNEHNLFRNDDWQFHCRSCGICGARTVLAPGETAELDLGISR